MTRLAFPVAAVFALTGCMSTFTDANSRDFQAHARQSFPSAQIHSVRVQNVQGSITITGAGGAAATVDSTRYAGHQDSIDNTQVLIDRNDGELDAQTHYLKTGWFASHGAGVDYTLSVAPGTSVHLSNVSGPIVIRNMSGNVEIQQVSGPITASLGKVGGERTIRINTVSGSTNLQIARDSDVTVDVKSVSGGVNTFFPANTDKGFVGQAVHAHLGNGIGSIDVNSVSGRVTITPQ